MRQLTAKKRPTVGIFGLTGCAGDQLVILDCEDELLELVGSLDIRDFALASSENDAECELDVALVEGAVLSGRDQQALERIRARSRILVAIGTCAVCGGVAAMDRDSDRPQLLRWVYGAMGSRYDTAPARALHEVVAVDLAIPGCPIEKEELLAAVAHLLQGNPPLLSGHSVCAECRMGENNCLLIERGEPCLGPLTVGGCGARCPALRIPCVGCRGPAAEINVASAVATLEEKGIPREEIAKRLGTFAPIPLAAGQERGAVR